MKITSTCSQKSSQLDISKLLVLKETECTYKG